MSDIPIQIVDEDDNPIGQDSIANAQAKGLKHRIARVMVEDKDGNILLQKRQATKRTYPNCWDNSAAGHVDAGESYETAAARELAEELGIAGYSLHEVAYYPTNNKYQGKILDRFNKMFKAVVPRDVDVKLQGEEVSEARWFTRTELADLVTGHPESVSDGLVEAYNICYQ